MTYVVFGGTVTVTDEETPWPVPVGPGRDAEFDTETPVLKLLLPEGMLPVPLGGRWLPIPVTDPVPDPELMVADETRLEEIPLLGGRLVAVKADEVELFGRCGHAKDVAAHVSTNRDVLNFMVSNN